MAESTSPPLPARDDVSAHPGMATAPGRVAIHTLGCRLNMAESELIRRQLAAQGYQLAGEGEAADVVIVNTCTVTAQADAKSRQALRGAKRRNPGALVAATGCYSQMQPEAAVEACGADLVVGNGEKLALPRHLAALRTELRNAVPDGEAGSAEPHTGLPKIVRPHIIVPRIERTPFTVEGFDPGTLVLSDGGTRAHLKIQDGCDFMCAFCIIPTARGRARPRDAANVVAEAEALAASGVREIVLTGVNVGTWEEGGEQLPGLLDKLADVQGLARLRIGSIEPTTVAEGLLERMADPAHPLAPFLHLPLQAGSARVLEAMRRRYAPGDYRAFAERALERVPELCLGTDVMAGHPGEDDEAFGETVAFLSSLPFAYFHVFPFSSRPGTAAHRMEAPLPEAVVRRRATALRALSDACRDAYQRRFLGRTLPVLFERPREDGAAQGLTPNYIRVVVSDAPADGWRNSILPVRLMEPGGAMVAGVADTT